MTSAMRSPAIRLVDRRARARDIERGAVVRRGPHEGQAQGYVDAAAKSTV